MERTKDFLALALDCKSLKQAYELIEQTRDFVGYYKIGKELINAIGLPTALTALHKLGVKTFVDVKEHDITNTVREAVIAAAQNGADIINIHCSNGLRTMTETVAAAKKINPDVKIVGVSVLTNLDDKDMRDIGCLYSAETQVWNLAQLAKDAGLDGLVCSGWELPAVRAIMGPDAIIIVPGIRIGWNADEQKRTISPYQAIIKGANIAVVGRPITQNKDYEPRDAAKLIHEEIDAALQVAKAPPQKLTEIFINRLIEIGAIKTGEFTLKFGGTSRIYISIRDLPNHPDVMSMAVWLMKMKLRDVQFDRVGGVPMGALSIANMFSLSCGKPVLTLREQPKDHGITGTRTVEECKQGDNVLVVEDVGTTGGSLIDSIHKYRSLCQNVHYAIVVVDRQQGAQKSLNRIGVELFSLITMHDIAAVICNRDDIEESVKNYMRQFL